VNGPCYIGQNVNVMGGDISGCSIGDVSKVRGELSSTVVAGYANKGHDGFVGHSYIGRWVNLGAGTVTSNLKNTYGTVALWTPTGVRDTGMQFLGTMFGDHVKTGSASDSRREPCSAPALTCMATCRRRSLRHFRGAIRLPTPFTNPINFWRPRRE